MPASEICVRFNNAAQKAYRGSYKPVVYAWETNDPTNSWSAEARLVTVDGDVVRRFEQASASTKQGAKDLAARPAYDWLRFEFPNLDLDNI
ncbi:hypothetical protein MD484_g6645, partial [Candolleomyces efflorescens]